MTLYIVTTTVGSHDEAERLARHLVEARLVACVHIDDITSYYRWDGELQRDTEVRLTLKTTEKRYDELEKTLADLHPYDIPAIVAVPVANAYPPYADWVRNNTAG
ncbi:MAG: divalent-cation tolerance protein CutA [Pseudomonadota bacterium]